MAQSRAMNSVNAMEEIVDGTKNECDIVKKELDVTVKVEALECLVCATRSRDCFDIYSHHTAASGASLHHFIAKYTQVDIAFSDSCSKFVCKSCYDLINILEQAEMEYIKLKETFEAILSKNPIFELAIVPQPIGLATVKHEINVPRIEDDSEDEPLARQRKTRNCKTVKKKKKMTTEKLKKKKINEKNCWECDECGASGDAGGPIALATHKLTLHTLEEATPIKTEEASQSPFNNGLDDTVEITFGDFDDDDDDDDTNFNPDEFTNGIEKKKVRKQVSTERKTPKVMHPCDQCNARYSSLVRLEAHKQKHDGSKPPYICEVCGAHYKHKRACDIHIALHKGISDWKCEECNKLFPSKNALQRHNNIHTGKLNYQCDLCGKSFIHTSSFKMHKLTHSGVKPHACDVCGLALMTRSHLKRHKRIHSGEKRHECQICGKRFSERYNLAAHQKAHEGGAGAGAGAGAAPPAEPRRRLFRCHFCVDRFERRYMLERHMAAVHGRTLERPPPTPRNTMSKLLKQRAQRPPPPAPAHHAAGTPPPAPALHAAESADAKDEPGASPRPPAPSKLLAQLTSSSSVIASGSWSSAYVAEFGLRADFPH